MKWHSLVSGYHICIEPVTALGQCTHLDPKGCGHYIYIYSNYRYVTVTPASKQRVMTEYSGTELPYSAEKISCQN